jgi:ubiquinone/menaquinone biosynthesis C-methylase UbiE
MLQAAMTRIVSLPNLKEINIRFVKADATTELIDLFGHESFDTVVDTFSLCVMGTAAQRCLEQMSRVVHRDGQLLLLENTRSSNPLLGIYQDATADFAAAAGGKGCVYNQDVASMIAATGRLKIESEQLYASGLFRSYKCTRLH